MVMIYMFLPFGFKKVNSENYVYITVLHSTFCCGLVRVIHVSQLFNFTLLSICRKYLQGFYFFFFF